MSEAISSYRAQSEGRTRKGSLQGWPSGAQFPWTCFDDRQARPSLAYNERGER